MKLLLAIPLLGKRAAKKIREQLGFGACRVFGSGSAPISEAKLRWFDKLGVGIGEGWGMSEASVRATLQGMNKHLESHERLGGAIIAREEWTTQNGMLTPILKKKRDVLEQRYRPLLDEQHAAFVVWE